MYSLHLVGTQSQFFGVAQEALSSIRMKQSAQGSLIVHLQDLDALIKDLHIVLMCPQKFSFYCEFFYMSGGSATDIYCYWVDVDFFPIKLKLFLNVLDL